MGMGFEALADPYLLPFLAGFEALAFYPQILLHLFFQALAFHHWALAFRQASGLYRLYLGLRDYALCLDPPAYA
tara:strand:- start:361 stop:582 length:222 start_codon:yes stop_codon:yes gene_type:complete